jgi:hypothetical protein
VPVGLSATRSAVVRADTDACLYCRMGLWSLTDATSSSPCALLDLPSIVKMGAHPLVPFLAQLQIEGLRPRISTGRSS